MLAVSSDVALAALAVVTAFWAMALASAASLAADAVACLFWLISVLGA